VEGLGELTSGLGAGDIGGHGMGFGGSGGGAASFFGVEARGTRFAYIVDVSGSMDAGIGVGELKRIDSLKHELTKSIGALLENASFLVVTFSDRATIIGGRGEWMQASESGKTQARKLIANIAPEGSTEPYPGFEVVYRMRPRPDAIYFMTDGEFDDSVVLQVARLNAELRIPIHCIAFVSTAGEETLKRMAKDSGGSYTYVPGPRR
jgi:hypothetical protein